ncbi:hypothetical protein BDF21DRAFT_414088 [Thamnidium elegans]|uniref:Uncharacterized protein n=1 Tax=Thamnidium elegans TaxID=101142 RepID=A0A8H7ST22_9FUNG|nr:hypothetical protein INT48_004386 [Thamnidium elegans]KAI8087291.1 hypothetical protein BDF21DRAFT_414088 [Thamnidium elegans]
MILRPSKIFVSFHQLRHYFQTKVSELVATAQPSTVVTQLSNYSATQQTIVSFSDVQRTIIKRVQQQPTNIHNENLLNMIQRHFPVAKVFSQPTLHGRSVMRATTSKQQFRTIVSSSGGGSTFFSYGLPRSATVGLGRNHGFAARQFSTTKTPFTVFQQQPPNVIAHISSRIFSPAGTKMTQPVVQDEKPKFVPFYSSQKDLSSSDEDEASMYTDKYQFVRVFKNTTKGMADILQEAQETEKHAVYKTNVCRKRKAVTKKSDFIVRLDDMSCLRNEGHIKQAKRSHNGTISRLSRRRPPDREKKKMTTSIYLLFDLNPGPFGSDWTTQGLEPSFFDSLETMARSYRVRIHNILKILDDLRFSGKIFRVVARHTELRVYFPSHVTLRSEAEAVDYLNGLGVQINDAFYTIVVEKSYVDPVVKMDYFKDLQLFLDCTDSLMQSSSSLFQR